MNTPSLTWLVRRALRYAVLFVLLFLVLPLALSAQEQPPGGGEAGGLPSAPPAVPPPDLGNSVASTLAVVNSAFAYQIEATPAPTSYAATGLPAWLNINTVTGLLSGTTPPEPGVFAVTISATNAGGTSPPQPLTITVGLLTTFSASPLLYYPSNDPTCLAFDRVGDLVVGTSGGNVYKITPTGGVSLFASGFGDIMGFAYDASGILYVAAYSAGEIWKVSPDGVASLFVADRGVGLHGVAFDQAGNLYYSSRNRSDFQIHKITIKPSGEVGVISIFAPDATFSSPAGLAFDGNGDLFVAVAGDGRVCKITPEGVVTTFAAGFANVSEVAFDHAGTLYVSDYTRSIVYKVSPSGIVSPLATTGFNVPQGLAFDAAGALYVVNTYINIISRIGLPLPVITSPTSASGTYASPFSYTITATNGPTEFTAEGLPAGLIIDPAAGTITGAPMKTGSFSVDLGVCNRFGTGFSELDLLVAKAAATVTLGNLTQSYDGATKAVSATTAPVGLPLTITYNDSANPPSSVGSYTVLATIVDDRYAGSATDTLRIVDTTPPVITQLVATPATLWPANHKMVPVNLSATATDDVGPVTLRIISATSNDPDQGLGDGDKPNDIEITGALQLNLRAERSDRGSGRTYTITVEAKDAAGNASSKPVTVFVPKNQSGR